VNDGIAGDTDRLGFAGDTGTDRSSGSDSRNPPDGPADTGDGGTTSPAATNTPHNAPDTSDRQPIRDPRPRAATTGPSTVTLPTGADKRPHRTEKP
jgi:hypothetical protein